MMLVWQQFTPADGRSYRELMVSDESDWYLFEEIAGILELALDGSWTSRLDGLDQRYWDLSARSGRLTLHLEHYIGIRLFPLDGADADPASTVLLEQAFDVLRTHKA